MKRRREKSSRPTPANPLHLAQQIKKDLIEKAKLRKEYAKVKAREAETIQPTRSVYDNVEEDTTKTNEDTEEAQQEPTVERHPDRTALIENTERSPTPEPQQQQQPRERQRKPRKPKPVPFAREHAEAQQRKEEAEERRRAREEAEKQRQQKIEERERFRKAMAKARTGGKNGQRKLGRESKILLERVQRMVSDG